MQLKPTAFKKAREPVFMCFFFFECSWLEAGWKCMHLDQTRQESIALFILFSYDFFFKLSPKVKIHACPHGNITGWVKFKVR